MLSGTRWPTSTRGPRPWSFVDPASRAGPTARRSSGGRRRVKGRSRRSRCRGPMTRAVIGCCAGPECRRPGAGVRRPRAATPSRCQSPYRSRPSTSRPTAAGDSSTSRTARRRVDRCSPSRTRSRSSTSRPSRRRRGPCGWLERLETAQGVFAGSARLSDVIIVDGVPRTRTASVSLAFVFVKGGVVPVDSPKASPAGGTSDPDQSRDVLPAEVLFTNNRATACAAPSTGSSGPSCARPPVSSTSWRCRWRRRWA